MRQEANYDILRMLPLDPGLNFLFYVSVFVSNIMENGWTYFHEMFMIWQKRKKKKLFKLFHAWLDFSRYPI